MRNKTIDYLRALGLILITIAHTSIPANITQYRSFDVVLLIYVSGMCMVFSENKKFLDIISKRSKQLLVPAYAVIVLTLVMEYISSVYLKTNPLSVERVLYSFLMVEDKGIPFVWIIPIYFALSMLIPLIARINSKIKSDAAYIAIAMCISIMPCLINTQISTRMDNLVLYYLSYITPYIGVAMMGYRNSKSDKCILNSAIASFAAFVCVACLRCFKYDEVFNPNNYKFPPQIEFLTFGLSVTTLLHLVLIKMRIHKMKSSVTKIASYISKNSLYIYLLQMFPVLIFVYLNKNERYPLKGFWPLEFLVILIFAIICCCILNRLKRYFKTLRLKIMEKRS